MKVDPESLTPEEARQEALRLIAELEEEAQTRNGVNG